MPGPPGASDPGVDGGASRELSELGLTTAIATSLAELGEPSLMPGRVFDERRGVYSLFAASGDVQARVAGRLRHRARANAELPAIGDWVAFRAGIHEQGTSTIHAVLPRRTKIARKVAGDRTDEQVLAANVDTAVIMMGLDKDLNLRRLDRFVALVRAGDVEPMVLLTKADLLGLRPEDLQSFPRSTAGGISEALEVVRLVVAAIPGVTVVPVSLLHGDLPGQLDVALQPARTVVLLGSSGVGKSTLLNRLMGRSMQSTAAVRVSDGRGRHTTTHRQMFRLKSGALVVDTPGLREIQLHASSALPDDAFPDIAELAPSCRFRDCHHDNQPGCAVQAAVDDGRLPANRLESYRRLRSSRVVKPSFPRPAPGAGRRPGSK